MKSARVPCAGARWMMHTVDRAISWIREQTVAGRRFFLNMSFQNSHFSYALPPDRPRPFQPGEIDFDASFARFPRDKTPIVRNAYYNAIHDCDQQLGRFIQALAEARDQLDKTILVVMGENGEAFYENGIVCHAGLPREPALCVGLVIHAPAWQIRRLLTTRRNSLTWCLRYSACWAGSRIRIFRDWTYSQTIALICGIGCSFFTWRIPS